MDNINDALSKIIQAGGAQIGQIADFGTNLRCNHVGWWTAGDDLPSIEDRKLIAFPDRQVDVVDRDDADGTGLLEHPRTAEPAQIEGTRSRTSKADQLNGGASGSIRIKSGDYVLAGHLESFAEQLGAIVGGAMQDMDDDQLTGFNAITDQVVSVNAPTDTMVFVARDEGTAIRVNDQIFTLSPQLLDE